jgi:hypothetical protein
MFTSADWQTAMLQPFFLTNLQKNKAAEEKFSATANSALGSLL